MINRRWFIASAAIVTIGAILPRPVRAQPAARLARRQLRANDRKLVFRLPGNLPDLVQVGVEGNGLWIHRISVKSRISGRCDVKVNRHVPPRRQTTWLPLPARGPLCLELDVTNLPLGSRATVVEIWGRGPA